MKPLIDKAKLLQELVEHYDVEVGQQISAAKLYALVRSQPEVDPITGYWYPAMDGDGWICSHCGADICYTSFDGNHEHFCRNCGAMMINADEFDTINRNGLRLK